MTPPLLDAALAYAAHGWPVFPCHTPTTDRRACSRVGKHPRTQHGLQDATTDEMTIRRWWQQWPQANIAIATGAVSNLIVLDEDTYKGGDTSRVELERTYQPLPETVQQLTGGGGVQYFFVNHVTLTGILERDPITRFADHGTQQVSFTLKLTEAGAAGQEFKLYVPCEAYSQAAEQAEALHAGDSVLVSGKLKWTAYTDKTGQKWKPIIAWFRQHQNAPALPAEITAGVGMSTNAVSSHLRYMLQHHVIECAEVVDGKKAYRLTAAYADASKG